MSQGAHRVVTPVKRKRSPFASKGKKKVKDVRASAAGPQVTEVHLEQCGPKGAFIVGYLKLQKAGVEESGYLKPVTDEILNSAQGELESYDMRITTLHRRVSREKNLPLVKGPPKPNQGVFFWPCVVACPPTEHDPLVDNTAHAQLKKEFAEKLIEILERADNENPKITWEKDYIYKAEFDHTQSPPRALDHLFTDEHVAEIIDSYLAEEGSPTTDFYSQFFDGGEGGEHVEHDSVFSVDRNGRYSNVARFKFGYPGMTQG